MSESAPTQPEIIAIVPAAGIGSRMQAERPKQYLILGQQTLLEHTLAALFAHPRITRAIIVISAADTYFPQLPLAQDPRIQVVIGGGLRADSVLAGLMAAENADWALVHDAARPCLHLGDLDRLLALTASDAVGGILASPVSDTMKRAQPGNQSIDHTVERQDLWHALTPQLFPLPLLIQCLQQAMAEGATVTDEASALEHCGYQPQLVQGRADNIKVTRPEDLALAAFYLTQLSNKERI